MEAPAYPSGQDVVIGDSDAFSEEEAETVQEGCFETEPVIEVVEDTDIDMVVERHRVGDPEEDLAGVFERLREGDPDLVSVRTEEKETGREGDWVTDLVGVRTEEKVRGREGDWVAVGLLVPRADARGLKRLIRQKKKMEAANITEGRGGRGEGGGGDVSPWA